MIWQRIGSGRQIVEDTVYLDNICADYTSQNPGDVP